MSTLKVDGIRSNSASSDAITLASDGTCTAKITNRSNRNLIINGAMQVAQRGTSSTSTSYQTVDRIKLGSGGVDEAPTQAQVDVASGTPAYQAGFRKAYKITNGNQTSGADAGDHIQVDYFIEAQDLANSGWDYTSSSSYVTLSFWIKSSVEQAFPATFRTIDGTSQVYNMTTGTISANTWTKITKTIPGNSNVQFDNDNGQGVRLMFFPHIGTTYTTNGLGMDTWSAWSNPKHSFQMDTTWWTTNDATWEITGLQLEVGSTATDFEHRPYGDELRRCQRYFFKLGLVANAFIFSGIVAGSQNEARVLAKFPVPMRANPTLTYNNLSFDSEISGSYESVNAISASDLNPDFGGRIKFGITTTTASNGALGHIYSPDTAGYLQGDSEL